MKEVVDRIVQYPNRYKLTDVSTGQDLGTYDFTEVPGTVQQEGTEINAELFESIEQDIENAGNFNPNGTYPNLTAGNATNATHATSADSATKATQDGQGRNIASTYALKSEAKKYYTHVIHVKFSTNPDEFIIKYDSVYSTPETQVSSFYYSISQSATSVNTAYPIVVKDNNEYVNGVVYAAKKDGYDALTFYYSGSSVTYKTNAVSSIRDVVIDWQ